MAPSPTGFLHIGGVHTFLFNWLFARGKRGECLLRIENTDTSREVAEATEQIQRSLQWIGVDWDGPVTFQLDAMQRCRELAAQLVAAGRAYARARRIWICLGVFEMWSSPRITWVIRSSMSPTGDAKL
jgi:glutamyl-tRNA synthetase